MGQFGGRVLLFFCCVLDGAEDAGYFAIEGGELEVDYAAAGMEDDVHGSAEGAEVFADGLAHAALDAVAIDGPAHDFAYGESHARACGLCATQRCTVGTELRTKSEEVRHLLRELLAAGLVDALIIGVFAETEDVGPRSHTAGPNLR